MPDHHFWLRSLWAITGRDSGFQIKPIKTPPAHLLFFLLDGPVKLCLQKNLGELSAWVVNHWWSHEVLWAAWHQDSLALNQRTYRTPVVSRLIAHYTSVWITGSFLDLRLSQTSASVRFPLWEPQTDKPTSLSAAPTCTSLAVRLNLRLVFPLLSHANVAAETFWHPHLVYAI